jgi:hypothetical protein
MRRRPPGEPLLEQATRPAFLGGRHAHHAPITNAGVEYVYDGENRPVLIYRTDNWADSLNLWYDYLGRRVMRVSSVRDSLLSTPAPPGMQLIPKIT